MGRLRWSVYSVPGPIQLPHLIDVQPTCVSLHWSSPVADSKVTKPVKGYRLRVWAPGAGWQTLIRFVAETSATVEDLFPASSYLLEVSAINEVGVGEPMHLHVHTRTLSSPASPASLDSPISPAIL